MERERKPPAPNVADDPIEPSAEDEKNRHREDDRAREKNSRTREEIRETTIPRKDD